MDGSTGILIFTILSLLCICFLLSIGLITLVWYFHFFGTHSHTLKLQIEDLRNRLISMQREIKILQAANLDLTRQVEEKKKTPPTKWENTQRISDNIQQNEQAYIPNKKELQSIEINKLDLETQIPANQQTYTELDSDQPESIDEMEQLSPELEAGQNKFEKNIQEISILSEQIETPQHESVPSQGQQKDQKVEQEESEPVQMLEQERKVPLLCKQCGKPLADDVRFCRHCGADVN